jgi:hypothetical protein
MSLFPGLCCFSVIQYTYDINLVRTLYGRNCCHVLELSYCSRQQHHFYSILLLASGWNKIRTFEMHNSKINLNLWIIMVSYCVKHSNMIFNDRLPSCWKKQVPGFVSVVRYTDVGECDFDWLIVTCFFLCVQAK